MNALDYLNGSSTLGRYIVSRYIIDALYRFTPFIRWDQIFNIVSLVLFIGCIIAKYILFEKAGERGWKSLIPFYSEITLSKIITGKKTLGIIWIASLLLYPIYQTVCLFLPPATLETLQVLPVYLNDLLRYFMIAVTAFVVYKFGRAYGKSTVWCIAMIFLSNILIIMMGFDKKIKYAGPDGSAPAQHAAE